MTDDDWSKEYCKGQAEHNRRKNGNISDLDVLFDVPADQWKESMRLQIIYQVGYDIRNDPSEEDLKKSMKRLQRLILTHGLPKSRVSIVLGILKGHWGDVPRELSDIIETLSMYLILQIEERSDPDRSLISICEKSNPEMLERIWKIWRKTARMESPGVRMAVGDT